jgi:hypothetical protein
MNYINAIELQNEKLKEMSWMQSHVIAHPCLELWDLFPCYTNLVKIPKN